MADVPQTITDPQLRAHMDAIKTRLESGLAQADPHGRFSGRPVSYRTVDGQTFEIVYREVSGIDESELLSIKRLIAQDCFCRVLPETAETVEVRFVVPLTRG